MICEWCGSDENVEETYDPYAQEIYDEEIQVVACEDCLYERRMDI